MFREILAPLRQCAVGHSQFAGNLGLRFLAGRKKAHRLSLKLSGVRFLLFLHGTRSPLWSFLFRVYSLHKGGPWSCLSASRELGTLEPATYLLVKLVSIFSS